MGWEEFVASLVGSLAWPAAVVAVLVVLRRPLARWFQALTHGTALKSFKAGTSGFEMAFDLRDAEETAEAVGAPDPADPEVEGLNLLAVAGGVDGEEDPLLQMARNSPTTAILTAWEAVERALEDLAARAGHPPGARIVKNDRGAEVTRYWDTPLSVARRISGQGLLPSPYVRIIRDLWAVRSRAAHDVLPEPTPDEAFSYVTLAKSVVSVLQRTTDELRELTRAFRSDQGVKGAERSTRSPGTTIKKSRSKHDPEDGARGPSF